MMLAPATGVLGSILAAWRRGLFIVVVSDRLLAEVEGTLVIGEARPDSIAGAAVGPTTLSARAFAP